MSVRDDHDLFTDARTWPLTQPMEQPSLPRAYKPLDRSATARAASWSLAHPFILILTPLSASASGLARRLGRVAPRRQRPTASRPARPCRVPPQCELPLPLTSSEITLHRLYSGGRLLARSSLLIWMSYLALRVLLGQPLEPGAAYALPWGVISVLLLVVLGAGHSFVLTRAAALSHLRVGEPLQCIDIARLGRARAPPAVTHPGDR